MKKTIKKSIKLKWVPDQSTFLTTMKEIKEKFAFVDIELFKLIFGVINTIFIIGKKSFD